MQLTINGPSVMAVEELKKKIENAGININIGDNSGHNERTDKYNSPNNIDE